MEESDYEVNSLGSSHSHSAEREEEEEDGDGSCPESDRPSELNQHQLQTQTEYREKLQKYLREPKATLLREILRLADAKG